MRVESIAIDWRPELPIFAKESFLKAVGDEYGWLGGFAESGELRCVLPYTIVRKPGLRMVRFRVETIPLVPGFDVAEEKSFLNGTIKYFRSIGADLIIPATTNTIFRTYPDGADAAPYGSYIIDLDPPEDVLWKNMSNTWRRNISTAMKSGVVIRTGEEYLDVSYELVKDTFGRSKLPFMDRAAYWRYAAGLGEYGKVLVADFQGAIQSSTLYAFSQASVYAIYGGNLAETNQGTMKLIQWEAIRLFKTLGVKRFDFVGSRIDPPPGSKQEALASFKRRFGATLIRGYMWKYPIKPLKYRLYGLASRFRSGGDIVDAERHKLNRPAKGNTGDDDGRSHSD
jgi:hypothetical protein